MIHFNSEDQLLHIAFQTVEHGVVLLVLWLQWTPLVAPKTINTFLDLLGLRLYPIPQVEERFAPASH